MGGVKDEKSEYYEGSLKNPIFRGKGGGGSWKTNIWRGGGDLPKKGVHGCLDSLQIQGGLDVH